jgi:hippurate hydrolase
MPVVNRIAAFAAEMKEWRRHIHMHPELGLDCQATAGFVVERLREFGVDEIHQGIGRTGVVALVRGRRPGPVIGLRADMDALPIVEATGAEHASRVPGRMHACGHDGHTSMLLGAARYLAETKNFAGTAALIFQPGEEGAGGARAMVEDGLMERFGIERVFGIHTDPDGEVGTFSTRPGPLLAAVDFFEIEITGRGGHAAHPETTADPIAATLALGSALQSVVSRNVPARHQAVLSLTLIQSGSANNIVPETARLAGTVRSYQPQTRDLIERRMGEICQGIGAAMSVAVRLDYRRLNQPTVNDAAETAFAAGIAAEVAAGGAVDADTAPIMAGEDFSEMLAVRPGAFLMLGQGKGPAVHNDRFDFNDEAAPYGASFFVRLVERALPL